MTVTTAILEDEKKQKVDENAPDAAAVPVVVTTKGSTAVANVHNRRVAAYGKPYRVFLIIITLIGFLCAVGGICYGIYHFAKIGHNSRPRVFCRIIEKRPIKSRIFSERAEISADHHAVRLFVPRFVYAHRVYSSSVVFVLENGGITVIKIEQSQTCFLYKVRQSSRRQSYRNHMTLSDWYRRVEEGSYLPSVRVLRRNWMAKMPHMSHTEAGVMFHPKVAEFCENMKVYRMIEVHDRMGVVRWGGGLLPRCPLRKCLIPCPNGRYVNDRNGCRTCRCKLSPALRRNSYEDYKAACGPFRCTTHCPLGFEVAPNGCPRCKCRSRISKRSAPDSGCRHYQIAHGMSLLDYTEFFILDDINVC